MAVIDKSTPLGKSDGSNPQSADDVRQSAAQITDQLSGEDRPGSADSADEEQES